MIFSTRPVEDALYSNHILKMPKLVFWMGALRAALRLRPRTSLVSTGSIIPSSHSLKKDQKVSDYESCTKHPVILTSLKVLRRSFCR